MSVRQSLASIERVQRELETLHRQIADESHKEAQRTDRLVKLQGELRRTTSMSTIQSKQREASRISGEVVQIKQRMADLNKKIATKQQELHRHQQDLSKAQGREQSSLLDRLRQDAANAKSVQHRAFSSLGSSAHGASALTPGDDFDAFICHASEDKDEIVSALAAGLIARGLRIWYDDLQLRVGDSLRRSIDKGLARSRFGIVVLSPAFFAKEWPQRELDGLVAKEVAGGKVVLPIWHRISKDDVLARSPTLADKVALSTGVLSVEEIVEELANAVRETDV
jgi:hypothetical protein